MYDVYVGRHVKALGGGAMCLLYVRNIWWSVCCGCWVGVVLLWTGCAVDGFQESAPNNSIMQDKWCLIGR